MPTSIAVSEETRKKLMKLKIDEDARSVDELLERMLVEHRKLRLLAASERFRKRLDDAGLDLEDLTEPGDEA